MLPSIYSKLLQSIQERVRHIKQFSATTATSNLLTYVRFYFTNTTNSTQWLYNEITFWDLISKVKNSKKIRTCTKVFFTHLNIHTKASLQVSFSSTKKTWTNTMIRFVWACCDTKTKNWITINTEFILSNGILIKEAK